MAPKVPIPCRIDADLLDRCKKAAGPRKLATFVQDALAAALEDDGPEPAAVGARPSPRPPRRPATRAKNARARATDQVTTRFKQRDSKGT